MAIQTINRPKTNPTLLPLDRARHNKCKESVIVEGFQLSPFEKFRNNRA